MTDLLDLGGDLDAGRKVRVQTTRSESVYDEPEYTTVNVDAAGHWDQSCWHDSPPGI